MISVTEQDYELLSQYLDGELPSTESELLEQRLNAEPMLATELAGLEALQRQLQSAYSAITDEPVPGPIAALLQPQPVAIVPLPHRRVRAWGFALAASLVVATSATLVTQWNQPADQASGADAMLALALEQTPSRGTGWETLADGRNVRPVLSFQSRDGSWCREYLVAGGDGNWHGVACRSNDGWSTAVLVGTEVGTEIAGSTNEYRPAGAMDSDTIADFIDLNAADIPLDASQEAELIARQWR